MRTLIGLLAFALTLFAAPAYAQVKKEQAIFAGGCFWCMEHDMKFPGVLKVESGYTGGKEKNPTYEQVSRHRTGHYEAVRVTYDASKITYAQIIERYWKLVDPTNDEGQFCDYGPQYRTAIFVTPEQKPIAEASKAKLIASNKINGKVVTPILPAGAFWLAEEEHRDFAENNAARYNSYRVGCQRDAVLKQIWKN